MTKPLVDTIEEHIHAVDRLTEATQALSVAMAKVTAAEWRRRYRHLGFPPPRPKGPWLVSTAGDDGGGWRRAPG